MKYINKLLLLIAALLVSSCYNKSVMFKTDHEYKGDTLKQYILSVEKTYMVQPNDYITFTVYTNKGERLIDPNFEIRKLSGVQFNSEAQKYLVANDSCVIFPMIGKLKIGGLKLRQLDSLLTTRYAEFYHEVFVISKIVNKRVFVIGSASAGTSASNTKVIPLENENMNLIEILTIAGGLDNLAKAHNIRLIRGDLKNPTVMIIDLSTIEGMKKANLTMQPNDIVYIERFQRKVIQTIQESSGIISVITVTLFAVIAIMSINKK
jgi:polysaccharide export outer membrane protein